MFNAVLAEENWLPANSQSKKVKTKHSLNNANSKKRMIQYIGLKMFAIAYFLAKIKSFSLNKDRYVRSPCYIHVKDSDYILITSFPNILFIFYFFNLLRSRLSAASPSTCLGKSNSHKLHSLCWTILMTTIFKSSPVGQHRILIHWMGYAFMYSIKVICIIHSKNVDFHSPLHQQIFIYDTLNDGIDVDLSTSIKWDLCITFNYDKIK